MAVDHLVGRVIGQYKLLELLGLGAMGAVYRALQPALEREVAVKVLPAALAAQPDYVARFTREAKIAASLEHPHIVPLHDYGTQDGISYVVMRLLNGGTLAERLNQRAREQGPLPSLAETARLLRQVAGALDYAHRKGVVHRDIKPNNILFDDDGTAYLVDFGIARLMNVTTSITGAQTVFGTPHYMPPEQWRDEELTPETDQYALGVVIYTMVTGQPPFDAPTSHALMYKHFHEEPPALETLRPRLPSALDDVLRRALQKLPGDRFLTVTAFSQAFDAAISDIPPRSTDFFTFPVMHIGGDTQPPLALAPSPASIPEADVAPRTNQRPLEPVAPPAPERPRSAVLPAPPPAQTPPPPARIPAPAQTSVATGRPSPLVVGVLGGLALLALVVCGGLALVASRGGFERDLAAGENGGNATPPTALAAMPTSVTADAAPDNQPTDLPVPAANTPITLVPVGPGGAPIAADSAASIGESAVLSHGTEPVRGASFSPDGGLIATGAANGDISFWSPGGELLASASSGSGVTYDLAFSPDSQRLVSGHEDGTLHLWNVADRAEVAVLRGHTGTVRDVAYSADGRYIASASEDKTARVWDAASGSPYLTLTGHQERVLGVAFSPGGTRIATASDDGTARVWDLTSGAALRTLSGTAGQVRAIAYSPTGDQLATAGTDGLIRLWDAETGTPTGIMQGHDGWVWSLAYSPDGMLLASGGRDATARLWDVATGQQLSVLRGHNGWVLSVAFSADGSRLITGGGDGTARIWDVVTG